MSSKIPKWRKPPVDVPVQALREFVADYGADVAVLTTWTRETGSYQFVTIGSDAHYADVAVSLRNLIARKLDLKLCGGNAEDLRGDHPNVSLNGEQIRFLLFILGRTYGEKEKRGEGFERYVDTHHDALFKILGDACENLANRPS